MTLPCVFKLSTSISEKHKIRKMREFPSDSLHFVVKESKSCAEVAERRNEEMQDVGKGCNCQQWT